MAVRHAILPIGAVLVLGLAVYLFLAVRSQPAPPVASSTRPAAPRAAVPIDEPVRTEDGVVLSPVIKLPPPVPMAPSAQGLERAAAITGAHRAKITLPGRFDAIAPSDAAVGSASDPLAGPQLEQVMVDANKAYDRGDFDEAKQVAGKVLARFPDNVRMLRVMVSASCMDGDSASAQQHYAKLPAADQEQMRVRCARYGISFTP